MLGLALGDALGLPFEGLPRSRIPVRGKADLRHRLLWGWGAVSDDADHGELVLIAAGRAGGDPRRFGTELARGLKWWFAALPPGVGLATARACVKLWLGVGADRSGAGVGSAGNGPLMRAPVLGALPHLQYPWPIVAELCDRSTLVTHRDPRVLAWARVVARTSRLFSEMDAAPGPELWLDAVNAVHDEPEVRASCVRAAEAAARGVAPPAFAAELGLLQRVSGFVMHTGPIAVHAALTHGADPLGAIAACLACGGDTDTTAAIAGAITGAGPGGGSLPRKLLERIVDWPRGIDRVRGHARALTRADRDDTAASDRLPRAALAPYPLRLLRNLALLLVVLGHGFARLVPRRPLA